MSEGADLTPLVDAMRQSWASTLALAESLGPDEWGRPTRCPGWDVHDQVAHIVSLEQLLAGGPLAPEAPPAAYIRNEFGAHMERGVHALRGTSAAELVEQLRLVIDARTAALQADPPVVGATMLGVMGNQVPVERTLPIRIFDLWAHEQDIRAAVGRPGNEDGPAAQVSRDAIAGMLPVHWAKSAGAVPGQVLVLRVTGGLEFERTVVVGPDGRAAIVPDGEVSADGDVGDVGAGPTTVIELSWADLAARACGRDGADESPVAVRGDESLGRAVLAALPMSP
jgi:uncharacterized protein (TIGR03083 family)